MDQDVEAAALIARPEFTLARTVLLVDDDELVLAHLTQLVQAAGFEVQTAGDGATALAFLRGAVNRLKAKADDPADPEHEIAQTALRILYTEYVEAGR